MTNVVLTTPPNGGPRGITPSSHPCVTDLSPKEIQPSVPNNALLVFGHYLTLIRAPLPKSDRKNRRNLVLQEHLSLILFFRLRILVRLCVRHNIDYIPICILRPKNQYRFTSCVSIGAIEKNLLTRLWRAVWVAGGSNPAGVLCVSLAATHTAILPLTFVPTFGYIQVPQC